MKKHKGYKRHWAEIRREKHKASRPLQYGCLNRSPIFGRFMLLPFVNESTVEYAKKSVMACQYLPLKAKLWHNARVVLLEPEWLLKEGDNYDPRALLGTLGWKAEIYGTLRVENLRRMIIANKRAAKQRWRA